MRHEHIFKLIKLATPTQKAEYLCECGQGGAMYGSKTGKEYSDYYNKYYNPSSKTYWKGKLK